jgi:hypothetical protein
MTLPRNLTVGGAMKQSQSFSPGLLYSISPGSFSSLHLQDEEKTDGFDWEAYESQHHGDSISEVILTLLKKTATHWGISKP